MSEPAEAPLRSTREAGIARLVLNRPHRLNAFTIGLHEALAAELDAVAVDPEVRVVYLTGAGRAFSAGQDPSEREVEDDAPLDLGRDIETYYNLFVQRLLALEVPLAIGVNGVAAWAGANIALLGDLVVAKRSARFIQSFAKIGLLSDCGGTWSLPHMVGHARAIAHALTGEPIGAEEAAAWGLIWKVVDDDALDEVIQSLLANLAAAPAAGLRETKRAIRAAWTSPLDAQLDLERDAQRRLGLTQDYREGVAAFKAKRAPQFHGR